MTFVLLASEAVTARAEQMHMTESANTGQPGGLNAPTLRKSSRRSLREIQSTKTASWTAVDFRQNCNLPQFGPLPPPTPITPAPTQF